MAGREKYINSWVLKSNQMVVSPTKLSEQAVPERKSTKRNLQDPLVTMRLSLYQLLTIILFTPLTVALQSIYFGAIGSDSGYVSLLTTNTQIQAISRTIKTNPLLIPVSSPKEHPPNSLNLPRPSECIAFFSDSNPCTDGNASFSYVTNAYCSGNFCNEPITILGHQNTVFTGCKSVNNTVTKEIPTGVSDNGAPALKCKPVSNPPGSQYGVYAYCPADQGNTNVGYVNVDAYCS